MKTQTNTKKQKEQDKQFIENWEKIGKPKKFLFEINEILKRQKNDYKNFEKEQETKENIRGVSLK